MILVFSCFHVVQVLGIAKCQAESQSPGFFLEPNPVIASYLRTHAVPLCARWLRPGICMAYRVRASKLDLWTPIATSSSLLVASVPHSRGKLVSSNTCTTTIRHLALFLLLPRLLSHSMSAAQSLLGCW